MKFMVGNLVEVNLIVKPLTSPVFEVSGNVGAAAAGR